MARPNPGPRLKRLKPHRGYAEPLWFAVWSEGGQTRRQSSGTSDSAAAQGWFHDSFMPSWRAAQHRAQGQRSSRDPQEVTVAEVLATYLEEHGPEVADPQRLGYAIAPLNAWWGEQPVSAIKGESCRRYCRDRGKAPGTTRRELLVLTAALNHCRREGYLTHRPDVWLPEPPPGRDVWLERHEVAALLRAARDGRGRAHLPLFILLGVYTGARSKASILPLQWRPSTTGGWVDLERGRIDFNPLARRQTKKRRPLIPIPARLATFLPHARKRSVTHVLEWRGEPIADLKVGFKRAARRAAVELWTWADEVEAYAKAPGVGPVALQRRMNRLEALHGLRGRELAQRLRESAGKLSSVVTPHVLRHTCCTWLMHAGEPIWDSAGFVGMDPETFQRTYGHHHPDYLKGPARALSHRQGDR